MQEVKAPESCQVKTWDLREGGGRGGGRGEGDQSRRIDWWDGLDVENGREKGREKGREGGRAGGREGVPEGVVLLEVFAGAATDDRGHRAWLSEPA